MSSTLIKCGLISLLHMVASKFPPFQRSECSMLAEVSLLFAFAGLTSLGKEICKQRTLASLKGKKIS